MNAHRLIELVRDYAGADPYELAAVIAAEQREADAKLADEAGQPAVAAAIRAAA